MAKDSQNKKHKKHWWTYITDAYTITKRTYPWAKWAFLGIFLLGLIIGVVYAWLTHTTFFSIFLALFIAIVGPLFLLTSLVKRASFAQIEGMTGATTAVLDSIRRGWVVKTEPVRVNPRTKDLVFRVIGRRGIILIAEGPSQQKEKLINDERRALKRVAPHASIHIIRVGKGTGEVPLAKLMKTMNKFPKTLSNVEVNALSQRLDALNRNTIPIPKGIDPKRARPDRKALRGK